METGEVFVIPSSTKKVHKLLADKWRLIQVLWLEKDKIHVENTITGIIAEKIPIQLLLQICFAQELRKKSLSA